MKAIKSLFRKVFRIKSKSKKEDASIYPMF